MARSASIERNTLETQIRVTLELDGSGRSNFETGVPFLEHMLDQIARHGLVDLDIVAHGDLHIDAHHTVEDLGITLGQAFATAAAALVCAAIQAGGRTPVWGTSADNPASQRVAAKLGFREVAQRVYLNLA